LYKAYLYLTIFIKPPLSLPMNEREQTLVLYPSAPAFTPLTHTDLHTHTLTSTETQADQCVGVQVQLHIMAVILGLCV